MRLATLNHLRSRTAQLAARGALALTAVTLAASAQAESPSAPNPVVLDQDGTVHIPAISVPVSSFLTPEGKAAVAEYLTGIKDPATRKLPDGGVPPFMRPYLADAKQRFAVKRTSIRMAGVKGYSYVPRTGIAAKNKDKILINLHGGGFGGCYPGCAELESIPIAAMGGIKVITLDYRQAPDHKFPAASEDVAAVYRKLLKTYKPENIGLYGCSAGGMLVGMSLAWFQKEGLPTPGAAGIFCAGMTLAKGPGFGGDSSYVMMPLGEAAVPMSSAMSQDLPPIPYLQGVDPTDPLAAPANSLDILAKFPPTLFITGTRAFDVSSAVYSHGRMIKAGAEADLHLWEGLYHGFIYNPAIPESQDAYRLIVDFFDRQLGRPTGKDK
jgi:acetyl esterase/lipase